MAFKTLRDKKSHQSIQKLVRVIIFLCFVIVLLSIALVWALIQYHECEFFDVLVDKYPAGCVWVGHMAPDTDSYCTAMAAAELFRGQMAISEAPNREIEFIIQRFGFPAPPLFKDLLEKDPSRCVGIVDHNQQIQSPMTAYNIPRENIIAIMDHHAIQSNIITYESIIHVDVRPWGSTSTLLYELYQYSDLHPSVESAQCMVAAILSDTLGLTSPTTTEWDRQAAFKLSSMSGLHDLQTLYFEMGTAKSNISGYTPREVLELDAKPFVLKFNDGVSCFVYWATIETYSPSSILADLSIYIGELQQMKADLGMDLVFFSIVDTFRSQKGERERISSLVLVGPEEKEVAMGTFNATESELTEGGRVLDVSPRVSRKLELIPALDYYISHRQSSYLPTRTHRKKAVAHQKHPHSS